MKVIVIGGEGFVGSGIVREALKKSFHCLVVNRKNYLDYAGEECDILINVSTNSRKYIANENPAFDFNETVENVKNSLLNFKYKKYILISSADVYSNTSDPVFSCEDSIIDVENLSKYGFHKYIAELCVQNYATNWLIFRMGGFIGFGLKKNPIFDILKNQNMWIDPRSKLQFINTDIAAEIVLTLAKNQKNQIFNLCGIGTVKLLDVINMMGKMPKTIPNPKLIHYEVSLEKIIKLVNIPTSEEMVISYLNAYSQYG